MVHDSAAVPELVQAGLGGGDGIEDAGIGAKPPGALARCAERLAEYSAQIRDRPPALRQRQRIDADVQRRQRHDTLVRLPRQIHRNIGHGQGPRIDRPARAIRDSWSVSFMPDTKARNMVAYFSNSSGNFTLSAACIKLPIQVDVGVIGQQPVFRRQRRQRRDFGVVDKFNRRSRIGIAIKIATNNREIGAAPD